MKLYHVVAVSQNNVIGKNNKLPWHFSADLKRFKALTLGHTVIMGRKTFESIGKALPGRENFVLSHTPRQSPGVQFFTSIEPALAAVKTEKAFIIGGEEVFKQTIGRIDGIYMTRIQASYEGDAFYPALPSSFKEKERELLQENPRIELISLERS